MFPSSGRLPKESVQVRGPLGHSLTNFYDELLFPRPTTKLEDHSLSAVGGRLFNVFPASISGGHLYPQPEEAHCRGEKGPNFYGPIPIIIFKYVLFICLFYVLYAPRYIGRVISKLGFSNFQNFLSIVC